MPTEAPSDAAAILTGREITFGPFRLRPERQLLLEGERTVRVGGRALDILIALVERPGELITKDELFARAWPNLAVEEGNLRSQIALLRKALNDGQAGARYIVAVPGRGYRFVAPVFRASPGPGSPPVDGSTGLAASRSDSHASPSLPAEHVRRLPKPISRVIGRDEIVAAISKRLERRPFITIVGPGGIGKTTVALTVANETASGYDHGVAFIDLAPVSSSFAISSVVASALGLAVVSDDPTTELVAFLQGRRLLLVLDSCEHILEAAGTLAEAVLRGAPGARILATSREPLRAEGESVHHLPPLETPPEGDELSATETLSFSAVELFVERAAASVEEFALTDETASVVAGICRKLDGMALAIELAAGRVDTFGVHGLAAQLDDRFRLLMQGRRTALPRHRTLSAALDWSYQFLSPAEQQVLRRLAVFVGGLTLEGAQAVAATTESESAGVVGVIADLVAKSLVSVNAKAGRPIYRLLDTMRAYAMEKLDESGERAASEGRHAAFYRGLLERAGAEAETRPLGEWLITYGREIDNIRKALDWAFSPAGEGTLGVALTVVALPLWMHLSLMSECRLRVEQALASWPPGADRDPRVELQLHHALGAVLLNIEASGAEMESALLKALEIAEALGETDYQLRVLWCLWCHALNRGAFREALGLADRFRAIAARWSDPVDPLTGERMRGFVLHFLGDQETARTQIEYMLYHYVAPVHRAHIIRFQFDQKITARNFLAQILWLQGFPEQALTMNAVNIEEARAFDHTMSLCNALTKGACLISLMAKDLTAAERFVEMLLARSARDGLPIWHAWGRCFKGILDIKLGAVDAGLELLRATLAKLPENRFSLRYTWVLGEEADGLRLAGRIAEGLQTIERALAISERDEELWCIPELFRIKGELLVARGVDEQAAERCFHQAIDWARRQRVLSWELRAALSFARLLLRAGRAGEALATIEPVYRQFSEGFATADLQSARTMIEEASTLLHR